MIRRLQGLPIEARGHQDFSQAADHAQEREQGEVFRCSSNRRLPSRRHELHDDCRHGKCGHGSCYIVELPKMTKERTSERLGPSI